MSRGDPDGRFTVTGLPAAEYPIIAGDALDPGEASDPAIHRPSRNARGEIFARGR
jgi:hypothetical protein